MPPPKLKAKLLNQNVWILKGADAELHSDFDQSGAIDSSASERKLRFKRPGAIIIPNLNLSEGLPAGVPGVDLSVKRDADDVNIQGNDDLSDLIPFSVQSPVDPLYADALLLRVNSDDLKRFRVFKTDAGTPDKWPAVFGKDNSNDYPVNFTPDTSWKTQFYMEALTLAGNPKVKGPDGPSPKSPLKSAVGTDKSGKTIYSRSDDPVYDKIGPGEIWMELIHKKAGKELKNNFDVGLFLISPFILQSNLEKCERIYVTYLKERPNQPRNHDFVYDLMEACWEAFGLKSDFDRDSSLEFTASTPADLEKADITTAGRYCLSPGKLYLIDGEKYTDEWAQDAFEMGYCSAPGNRAINVVVQCKRDRPLGKFVKKELPHKNIALFNDLEGVEKDGTDYGGNIEVSPPVLNKTKKEKKGDAGPAVPAAPDAPFGKIILGDCKNTHRSGEGLVHDETRDLFTAQVIQPILPINTSWLIVGHVDEFMSFVPANTTRGSCLLVASVHAMNILLNKIKNIDFKDGRTNFHRGKFERYPEMITYSTEGYSLPQNLWNSYAEVSAEELLNGDIGKYSQKIRKKFMLPITGRLMRCTGHKIKDAIQIPIYFKPGSDPSKPYGHAENMTVAETVGMVNMQVVNNHLMIPRPFGPRMPKAIAEKIVKETLKTLKLKSTPVKSLPDNGFTFWAWPGLSLADIALFFTQPHTIEEREELIERIKDPAHKISGSLKALVKTKMKEIFKANNDPPSPISSILSGGDFDKWKRLTIPEKSVDVIETYMLSVLSHIGCKVHFVDDWYYHTGLGEAHCGTNAKRSPPSEASLKKKWWEVYDPSIDLSYDPKT